MLDFQDVSRVDAVDDNTALFAELPAHGGFDGYNTVRLINRTMTALKATFNGHKHFPSKDQWTALEAIVDTLASMADGSCPRATYLSSLDPGVGKTSAIIHFVRVLLNDEAHEATGVLICLKRHSQIKDFIRESGLKDHEFAVFTAREPEGKEDLNPLGLGRDNAGNAQVLLTTHAMVERLCKRRPDGYSFADIEAFQYQGEARPVRVHDEALLPGMALTVPVDDLGFFVHRLRKVHTPLAMAIGGLHRALMNAEIGTTYDIPDLAERFSFDMQQACAVMAGNSDDEQLVEQLWFLFGKTVTVRSDCAFTKDEDGKPFRGNTILDYEDTLPDDLWPILVLDASGRVRTLYKYWENRRGGLQPLPSGAKSYDEHTVNLWSTPGSKSAWRNRTKAMELVEGIVETIKTKSNEEWLVVIHKTSTINKFDVEQEVKSQLPTKNKTKIHFLSWGLHDATNAYADVPNVILAGTLFYPPSLLEAQGRLTSAIPSSQGDFTAEDIKAVQVGEHKNLILQALCRGAVRKCVPGGGCTPQTNTYIIAAARSGIGKPLLQEVLPGCKVVKWQPVNKAGQSAPMQGKKAEALQAIVSCTDGYISIPDVMASIGWKDNQTNRKAFRDRIRQDDEFMNALEKAGFNELRNGNNVWFEKRASFSDRN